MQIPNLDDLFPNIFTQTFFTNPDYIWFRKALGSLFSGGTFRALSFSFTLLFIVGIIYTTLQIQELEKEAKEKFKKHPFAPEQKAKKNDRWEGIKTLCASPNQADWRIAIIEADSMLDEMLSLMKVPGGHIGEKLRYLDRKFFPVLDQAWNAHKFRNRIAHEGIAFHLEPQMVANAIRDYEKVFREMNFI